MIADRTSALLRLSAINIQRAFRFEVVVVGQAVAQRAQFQPCGGVGEDVHADGSGHDIGKTPVTLAQHRVGMAQGAGALILRFGEAIVECGDAVGDRGLLQVLQAERRRQALHRVGDSLLQSCQDAQLMRQQGLLFGEQGAHVSGTPVSRAMCSIGRWDGCGVPVIRSTGSPSNCSSLACALSV